MYYRTRTYLAGDWDGDQTLINTIISWNDSNYLSLTFSNAHDLKQARDDSLSCSIKRSLADRMNGSKTFVLIVGEKTKVLTRGSCKYCDSYSSVYGLCRRSNTVDLRSFVGFECEKAVKDGLRIVVIYNDLTVDKSKCPDVIRNIGVHIAGLCIGGDGKIKYDYSKIRNTLNE